MLLFQTNDHRHLVIKIIGLFIVFVNLCLVIADQTCCQNVDRANAVRRENRNCLHLSSILSINVSFTSRNPSLSS